MEIYCLIVQEARGSRSSCDVGSSWRRWGRMCPCFSPGFWLFVGNLWLVDASPQSLASPAVYMSLCLNFPFYEGLAICVLSRVWLCVTPLTAVHQTPLSIGFSRQAYWSGLPFPILGVFLTQESNLHVLCLLHWQVDSLPLRHLGIPL